MIQNTVSPPGGVGDVGLVTAAMRTWPATVRAQDSSSPIDSIGIKFDATPVSF